MPISGIIPTYLISTVGNLGTEDPVDLGSGAFTGAIGASSGQSIAYNQGAVPPASAFQSMETLQNFYRRAIGVLAGKAAGAITSGTVSGLGNLQKELAARVTDIELAGTGAIAPGNTLDAGTQTARTAYANVILAASGEVA